jgi:glutamate N-acetyltransferase / amino-acid N-acetyltransferase
MPVNLHPPEPSAIRPVAGVELGFAMAGIKRPGRRDVMLVTIKEGASVAAIFTQNSFAAAPVQVCRQHLASGRPVRALVVNAGNANCGTGEAGLAAARASCLAVAELVGCEASQVLPFSTGVILEPLPVEKLLAALPDCKTSLDANHWCDAASAIMTTDTVPKAFSTTFPLNGVEHVVTGIAKGVGMLQPNMATMLAFVATNACVERKVLSRLVKRVADRSFNRVTVDGDTSTNDSFVMIATGALASAEIDSERHPHYAALEAALVKVSESLAQAIARDGEGATKFITVIVNEASDEAEAVHVAKAIAHSPLVKTAFFASDPNLGRLLMAIGNAGIAELDVTRVRITLGDVLVIAKGERAPSYREEDGARVMRDAEIVIHVDLGRASASATVWTCDFSYDYVKINAEYRT